MLQNTNLFDKTFLQIFKNCYENYTIEKFSIYKGYLNIFEDVDQVFLSHTRIYKQIVKVMEYFETQNKDFSEQMSKDDEKIFESSCTLLFLLSSGCSIIYDPLGLYEEEYGFPRTFTEINYIKEIFIQRQTKLTPHENFSENNLQETQIHRDKVFDFLLENTIMNA